MAAQNLSPKTRMRVRWRSMLRRCENPKSSSFYKYGARGITVCDRWHDFELFLADVGFPPAPGMSLDRIDNDGPYEPVNVRWATASEQRRNQRERTYKYVARCGTEGGYKRHLDRGETTCDECRAVHAASVKRRKEANREAYRAAARKKRSCPECGKGISRDNLRRHIAAVHVEVQP